MRFADRFMLRRWLPAAAMGLALIASGLAPRSAHAGFFDNYWQRHYDNLSRAWCAYYFGESSSVECAYDTIAQCRASVSGVGGFCSPNPNYVAAVDAKPARRRSRHRHDASK